jgi:hypothetical protein
METFFFKLAVATIPLILLVLIATGIAKLSDWYAHEPLSWHRSRRHFLRALASGIMLR